MLRIRGSWKKTGGNQTKHQQLSPMGLRDSSTRNVFFFWGGARLSLIFRLFFLALRPFSLVTSYFSSVLPTGFSKAQWNPLPLWSVLSNRKFLRFHCRKKKWWCRFAFFISLMASGHTMFVVGILFTGLVGLLLLSQIWVRFSDLFPSTKRFRLSGWACFGLSQSCWPSSLTTRLLEM